MPVAVSINTHSLNMIFVHIGLIQVYWHVCVYEFLSSLNRLELNPTKA